MRFYVFFEEGLPSLIESFCIWVSMNPFSLEFCFPAQTLFLFMYFVSLSQMRRTNFDNDDHEDLHHRQGEQKSEKRRYKTTSSIDPSQIYQDNK